MAPNAIDRSVTSSPLSIPSNTGLERQHRPDTQQPAFQPRAADPLQAQLEGLKTSHDGAQIFAAARSGHDETANIEAQLAAIANAPADALPGLAGNLAHLFGCRQAFEQEMKTQQPESYLSLIGQWNPSALFQMPAAFQMPAGYNQPFQPFQPYQSYPSGPQAFANPMPANLRPGGMPYAHATAFPTPGADSLAAVGDTSSDVEARVRDLTTTQLLTALANIGNRQSQAIRLKIQQLLKHKLADMQQAKAEQQARDAQPGAPKTQAGAHADLAALQQMFKAPSLEETEKA